MSSQEPLVNDSLTYNTVCSLASDELHSSSVTGTDMYEALYQSSAPANTAPNNSHQQHNLEHEYAYPEVILAPGRGVHVASDANDSWLCVSFACWEDEEINSLICSVDICLVHVISDVKYWVYINCDIL